MRAERATTARQVCGSLKDSHVTLDTFALGLTQLRFRVQLGLIKMKQDRNLARNVQNVSPVKDLAQWIH